ncbi:prophage endopeptidase tail family protein [Staphylococcus simiae]|uniref:Peptidase n=1 Tax=Staphylococcus simiae CCM 7213 = CCUG 51256 TaxID=911238 RepID=G5JH96_9STAP|nr:prophage endopeptidase tail family protein [Staphylococcus simiae]EHJ08444.1 hypothetical protein SS7213T_04125 [Staphylococcus simiae CCM 7213 = CCUG 51256]PNZ12548.1 peptidase [Staphylococcus simiae]SNV67445.1 prophage endopeptidase tail family protein [Staphylococcus simiae]
MDTLVLKNKNGTYGEVITDFDFGSFKYEYEKNNERSISFTVYKTTQNYDIFDNLLNEMIVEWQGQEYVIKSTSLKYDGVLITNEIVAKHIFMELQNHFIEKNLEDEEMNNEDADESVEEPAKSQMTLKQYLDIIFSENQLGYTYEIIGNFNKSIEVEELGDKNGLEMIVEGADLFNYIYFADNKKIYIYDEESFYKMSDIPLIYHYNSSEVQATTTTTDVKTYIKGYGKKKTKAETKNYNPIKPKDLKYTGVFNKKGTWTTEEIGASYEKEIECKWGNERLEWTLKKMSKGGILEVYLDGKLVGNYDCYSETAHTEKILIATKLTKGKHLFKVVFKGDKKGVDYKKSKSCMYVGTEKATIINLTAVLKGTDLYNATAEYKSPNYDIFGHSQAPTIYDDNALDNETLLQTLKENLNDQPTVEVTTNYLGSVDNKIYLNNGKIKENNMIRFIHKPIGFNVDLKVVKLTMSHPYVNEPIEVDFSNSPTDIIKIQQQINRNVQKVNNMVKGGLNQSSSFSMPKIASDSIGSVLVNE